jgi:hypothetical protein
MCNDKPESPSDTPSPSVVEADSEVEYSEEFAAMILDQEENGSFQEIDVDDMLAMLDRMILEAQGLGTVH